MRSFILISLFVLVSIASFAQAPKKSNHIIVKKDSMELYTYLSEKLLDDGYSIVKSDKDLLTITTDYKQIKAMKVKLSCYIRGNEINISGTASSDGVGEFKIENIGMKGSPTNKAWVEMEKFATLLMGNISYLTK